MNCYRLTHLADHVLLCDLREIIVRDRRTTVDMLAHIAEVDTRRLYLPAAYPSMHTHCVGELRLSEDAAFKRSRAARAALQFPGIYPAVADGSLSLSAIVMLAPHSTNATASDLLSAAVNKPRSELELLLAHRFPQPDVATQIRRVELAAIAGPPEPAPVRALSCQLAPGPVSFSPIEHAPAHTATAADVTEVRAVAPGSPRAKVTPLSPQRFALQVTITQATHDKLSRAQELLSHALPSGDVAQVLDRALDSLIYGLEKRKYAAAERPRSRRSHADRRSIPAEVKRAVRERDGEQCTFVSDSGHHCSERRFLELDHVDPVARGGRSTVAGLRLRCRAHNQHAAERAFGKGFMRAKREAAGMSAALKREAAPACAQRPGPGASAPA